MLTQEHLSSSAVNQETFGREAVMLGSAQPAADVVVRLLHRGDRVYHQGGHAKGVYSIKAGAIKTFTVSPSGDQQVLGFHMSGDVIGFDALADGRHQATAEVLDTSAVCFISFDAVHRPDPAWRNELLRQMSALMQHDNELLLLMARRTAAQRLAWFLVQLADRLRRRGLSEREFTLAMSRADIGNYLGLAMETVCREFAGLKESGIINFDRRRVGIVDLERLHAAAEGGGEREALTASGPRAALH